MRLLGALRARAAAGSELAASLATHREGLDSGRVAAVANSRRGHPAEPWLTILPAAAHLGLLGRAGWRVDESVDAAQLGTGAEPGRSLLVTARPSAGATAPEDTGRLRRRCRKRLQLINNVPDLSESLDIDLTDP